MEGRLNLFVKLLISLLFGLGIILAGIYVVTSRPSEPEAMSHPKIDKVSRDALLQELRREEGGE